MATPSPTSPKPQPQTAAVGVPPPEPLDDFDLFNLVEPEARANGVSTDLALRVIRRESRGNPHAVSPKGAQGLMQLMPPTAQSYGVTNPFDPTENVKAGIKHLGSLLKKHKGDQRAALAEYNGGAGAVAALRKGTPWKETAGYLGEITGGPPAPGGDDFDQFNQEFTPEAMGVPGPQQGVQVGGPPPAPPNPQDLEYGTAKTLLAKGAIGAAEALDPTTPEGRRNLAGGAGALAVGAMTGGMAPLGAAALAAGGAATAGGLAESAEQAVGTKPKDEAAISGAFRQQGAYEAGGQALLWPLQAVGRRAIASRVGQFAGESLSAAKQATVDRLSGALEAAQGLLRTTRQSAAGALRSARTGAADALRAAREGIQTATEQATAGPFAPYEALTRQPPPSGQAVGREVQEVIAGPAKTARDRAGQAVDEAAESGPAVNIRDLKLEAQKVLEEQLRPASEAFPHPVKAEAAGEHGTASGVNLADLPMVAQSSIAGMSPEAKALMAAAAEQQTQERLKHPIMSVIQRILSAEDEVPFAAAHGFKKELDDALLGTWDKVERKRVSNLTMKLRGTLRETMGGHAPYDEATAAYAKIAPLYTKGYMPQLRKLATDDPEAVVRLINPRQPTKVGMLRELLTTQAAEGGDAAAGQAAWDHVRSAWTHANLIQGGVKGLEQRLAKITPDFEREMFGDASGKQVLANVRQIQQAYTQALERTSQDAQQRVTLAQQVGRKQVEETRALGRAQVETTRTTGQRQVNYAGDKVREAQRALKGAKEPTPEEARFLQSTLAPGKTHPPEQVGADLARSLFLSATAAWGNISRMRLLFGPKSADLIEWAAYSPKGTQMLVSALTSSQPGAAMADVLRAAGLLDREKPPSPQVGQPPPGP